MMRACEGGEARARRRTSDEMNDVDALDVARPSARYFPLNR
jgi:hypothetical protein